MITKDNLTKYILEKSSGFNSYLELSDSEWKEEGDYTVLAEYCRYILGLYKENKTEQLKKSFYLVNDIFVNGDHYVKEAITIGFLETLQNNISWGGEIDEKSFLPFLSEALKTEWNNLNNFWKEKTA
ncbi:hypothetical protein K2X96_00980 [Patescibacteria group bacterium]|nr:hypothetical protein [Patescibacteria group bacterium]